MDPFTPPKKSFNGCGYSLSNGVRWKRNVELAILSIGWTVYSDLKTAVDAAVPLLFNIFFSFLRVLCMVLRDGLHPLDIE